MQLCAKKDSLRFGARYIVQSLKCAFMRTKHQLPDERSFNWTLHDLMRRIDRSRTRSVFRISHSIIVCAGRVFVVASCEDERHRSTSHPRNSLNSIFLSPVLFHYRRFYPPNRCFRAQIVLPRFASSSTSPHTSLQRDKLIFSHCSCCRSRSPCRHWQMANARKLLFCWNSIKRRFMLKARLYYAQECRESAAQADVVIFLRQI